MTALLVGPFYASYVDMTQSRNDFRHLPFLLGVVVACALPVACRDTEPVTDQPVSAEAANAETETGSFSNTLDESEAKVDPASTSPTDGNMMSAGVSTSNDSFAHQSGPGNPSVGAAPSDRSLTSGTDIDPVDMDPVDVDPADMDPADMDPVNVSPAEVDPADMDPANMDPVNVNPAEVDPADMDPANVDPVDVDPVDVDPRT